MDPDERCRTRRLRGAMKVPAFRTLVSGAFLVLAVLPAFAQQPNAEEVPAYNDLFARTILIETLPLVEKHTGWKIPDLPKFRLVRRDQYAKVAAQELVGVMRKRQPKLSEADALAAAERALQGQANGLLGRYSFLTRTIYLLPGNLKPMATRMKIEHWFTRDLIEIIIAHEMTHAAQDARFPHVEKLAACADDDARAAYGMLVEGHAMFIQERVAADLKISEAAARLGEQMAAETGTGGAGWTKYVAGKKFVQAAFDKGGIELVQKLFTKPPRAPLLVLEPENYFLTDGRELLPRPVAK